MATEELRQCCLDCGHQAVMIDTENDDAYCAEHAAQYRVYEGPYRMVEEEADAE